RKRETNRQQRRVLRQWTHAPDGWRDDTARDRVPPEARPAEEFRGRARPQRPFSSGVHRSAAQSGEPPNPGGQGGRGSEPGGTSFLKGHSCSRAIISAYSSLSIRSSRSLMSFILTLMSQPSP